MDLKDSSVRLLVGTGADALQVLTDLRERIEIVHTQEYPNFLAIMFPVFKVLMLERITVSFQDDEANKFRRVILEILNRLPNNDVLRPYTIELLDLATKVLVTDNEENALTAVRILFDLHKNLRNIKCVQCPDQSC